ncbi:MAG TPA: GNAT family N-acetyltransferase [Allosphingosinicella sp.]|jgi:predicted acetyltransferase
MTASEMRLVRPAMEHLPSYAAALGRGWAPDNTRGRTAAEEQLEWIGRDPHGFLASLDDPEAKGAPVKLPDGSTVPRLPGFVRWMWEREVCGSIGFRWQPGTAALPPHVLGHIGFSVVPWRRREGLGKRALALMLGEARLRGLPYVEITTDPDNKASQGVIEANGGILVERFTKLPAQGGAPALRFRIALD